MIYDTSKEFDVIRANAYFEKLKAQKKKVEIKSSEYRSSSQNRYLHLIIGWFASETGYTLNFVKREYYKIECNSDIYVIEVPDKFTGEIKIDLKSSRDIKQEKMTLSITRFRNWSSEKGIYLPSSDEKQFLEYIDFELKKIKEYL